MFLETKSISKEFGKLRAVNEVTLEIAKGTSTPSSAPMEPARAPISTSSQGITGPTPERSCSRERYHKASRLSSLQAGNHSLFSNHQHLSEVHGLRKRADGALISSEGHAQLLLQRKEIFPGRGLAHPGGCGTGRPGQTSGRFHLPRGQEATGIGRHRGDRA